MRGSVILWSLMASAPALLLGVLGIVGRTQISTWEFEAYSRQQTKDLLEYQTPVKAALPLQGLNTTDPKCEARTIAAAEVWLKLEAEGKLKDVLPGSMNDQGSTGAKMQILEARQAVINLLTFLSYDKRHQGLPFESAMASARAIAIGDIFKYSGSAALQLSGMSQASNLRSIGALWPRLTKNERTEVRAMLRRAYRPDDPVRPLAEKISHLSIRSRMRLGHGLTDLDTIFQVSQIKELVERRTGTVVTWGPHSEEYGLDNTFSNAMSAALRIENRLQKDLSKLVNLN